MSLHPRQSPYPHFTSLSLSLSFSLSLSLSLGERGREREGELRKSTTSREANTFWWFTLIKLMEWNACALADSTTIAILDTRLGLEFRLEVWRELREYVGMYVQKFAFLASVTRQTEVVYKELHLKATQKCYHSCPEGQKPELENSESGVGFFLHAHMQFL